MRSSRTSSGHAYGVIHAPSASHGRSVGIELGRRMAGGSWHFSIAVDGDALEAVRNAAMLMLSIGEPIGIAPYQSSINYGGYRLSASRRPHTRAQRPVAQACLASYCRRALTRSCSDHTQDAMSCAVPDRHALQASSASLAVRRLNHLATICGQHAQEERNNANERR